VTPCSAIMLLVSTTLFTPFLAAARIKEAVPVHNEHMVGDLRSKTLVECNCDARFLL
jgi:hypothetical protein